MSKKKNKKGNKAAVNKTAVADTVPESDVSSTQEKLSLKDEEIKETETPTSTEESEKKDTSADIADETVKGTTDEQSAENNTEDATSEEAPQEEPASVETVEKTETAENVTEDKLTEDVSVESETKITESEDTAAEAIEETDAKDVPNESEDTADDVIEETTVEETEANVTEDAPIESEEIPATDDDSAADDTEEKSSEESDETSTEETENDSTDNETAEDGEETSKDPLDEALDVIYKETGKKKDSEKTDETDSETSEKTEEASEQDAEENSAEQKESKNTEETSKEETSEDLNKEEEKTMIEKASPAPLASQQEKKTEETVKSEDKPKKEKKKKKHSVLGIIGRIVGVIVIIGLIAGIVVGVVGWRYYESLIADAPELDLSKREEYSVATEVYDADGNWIANYASNENIDWAEVDEVPQILKDAFVSIEDVRFYTHHGIDLKRLTGAVLGQLTGTASYGASTITQQLIKNTYLTQEVSYKRKAQEIHLALELEKVMDKEDILNWYMNTLYLGESNYGIKAAAKDYFGKELDELTLREAACIAGLAQSPNAYNPRTNYLSGDMTATDTRTNNVLYAMYTNGAITEEEYNEAINDTLVVVETRTTIELYDYPTYVEYAIENVATALLEQEGTEVNDETLATKKQEMRNDGYKIYTAFDSEKQDIMQDAITNFSNYPNTVDGLGVQTSAVLMDQHTGEVVAMVGGLEEPTEPEGFNRATDSTQPVGSSMKPLSVYAPAIELGDYPGTTVLDAPTSIEGYGVDNSYPNGETNNSMITMRRALELSHNIPAARFLLEHVGLQEAYDFLVNEGFQENHIDYTAAGIALGASSVTTLEMTAAYAALANGGVYIEPHAYTIVYDRNGNVVLDGSEVETHRVFSESTAWLVTDMLETNMTDGLGVRARLTNVKSCGKTGTHEASVISFGGYTPYYTSFVRTSSDTYSNMINPSSYYMEAPLWKSYMDPIHEGLDADKDIQESTAEDLDIKRYYVCENTGKLAGSYCSGHYEYAAPSNAPTETCDGSHTYYYQETEYDDSWNSDSSSTWWYSDGTWSNGSTYTDGSAIDWSSGWWDEYGQYHY